MEKLVVHVKSLTYYLVSLFLKQDVSIHVQAQRLVKYYLY